MSLYVHTLQSHILNKGMNISVYVPDDYLHITLPVLYFLHGRTGNEELLCQLGMDRTADSLIKTGKMAPLIIVCPNMDNSRGLNSADNYEEFDGKYGIVHKGRYEDYFIDEVIPFIDSLFSTVNGAYGRFVGGVSAGGYAALNIGLRHQDLFSRIGGHMPAIDLSYEDEDECYFRDRGMWLENDPVSIAEMVEFSDISVYLDDGKDDEGKFYISCEKLYYILKSKGVKVENHVFEGHHNGEYLLSNMENYLGFYGSV